MTSTSETRESAGQNRTYRENKSTMFHNQNNRIRVLVADDQPDVLEALRLLLKTEGFEIEAAASPPRCWRRSRRANSMRCSWI